MAKDLISLLNTLAKAHPQSGGHLAESLCSESELHRTVAPDSRMTCCCWCCVMQAGAPVQVINQICAHARTHTHQYSNPRQRPLKGHSNPSMPFTLWKRWGLTHCHVPAPSLGHTTHLHNPGGLSHTDSDRLSFWDIDRYVCMGQL